MGHICRAAVQACPLAVRVFGQERLYRVRGVRRVVFVPPPLHISGARRPGEVSSDLCRVEAVLAGKDQ
eukprot:scaffold117077_cov69-Phaeocystis_antarctica.AAC.2